MSDRPSDVALSREIGSLIDALEDLQGELDPRRRERRRLPTPGEFLRFTSEVTIPATVLVLETNVRVLKLLQRIIRTRTGESAGPSPTGSSPDAVRRRAEELGRETLSQLDRTLSDLQSAVEGRPRDDEAAALLTEARRLQDQVKGELSRDPAPASGLDPTDEGRSGGVAIDVEAELESIKDDLDDAPDDGSGTTSDGSGDSGTPGDGDGDTGAHDGDGRDSD